MRAALVPALVLASGCHKLFQLQHLDDPGDAAQDSDARVVDAIDGPPDMITQTHSSCPTGFFAPFEDSQYYYVSDKRTWFDAMRYCASLDDPTSTKRVHLPVLTSGLERSNHIYVNVAFSASGYWIGYSDTANEGTYVWVTADPTLYVPQWGPGEPTSGTADNCVRIMESNNDFDSMACTVASEFVCECDNHKLEPARYVLM